MGRGDLVCQAARMMQPDRQAQIAADELRERAAAERSFFQKSLEIQFLDDLFSWKLVDDRRGRPKPTPGSICSNSSETSRTSSRKLIV